MFSNLSSGCEDTILLLESYCCTVLFEREDNVDYVILIKKKQATFCLFSKNLPHMYSGVGLTRSLIVDTFNADNHSIRQL